MSNNGFPQQFAAILQNVEADANRGTHTQGLQNMASQQTARERDRAARAARLAQREQRVQQRVRGFSCGLKLFKPKKNNGNGGPNARPVMPTQASQSGPGASTSGRVQTPGGRGQRSASGTRG